ncbi:family 1 glycosylhydrolase [Flavisolibacter ginsengisoli]|uniref:Beta-glucosidase/6-phospho-beta-glucosidase/beta-galactosidase n=1 Tax=Flavisolibacter ginsengisoli DSM 18119 TaxID=1121884 RepID=A0A1M5FWB9_9BACT|nr:family 1 glycosylhydrolase [Flavisolibacter ginsengisoli]SHF95870.1 Beta-glucosidase/6-phospho-beta-glucosidase/beta-galactosidase [Flavisolibacter ginsengisoli DSM 18119]
MNKMNLGSKFMFATGIENSYPTIQLPDGSIKRVDEMEKCCHYKNWEKDFELTKEQGIEFLRYGPPYYKTHTGPGTYDWDFTDATFNRLKELDITPIVDLLHFGVPDWMGNFQNPEFPELFAEYAGAFAERFPDLQLYTPINEIFITALFSAQYGWWNERLTSDHAFVTALKHLCKANVMAMHAILKVRPDAIFIQSESSEYFHPMRPEVQKQANFLNRKRFLALDLTYGYPISVQMYEYMLQNGMTSGEYYWFEQNQVKARCIMGNDYYATNEHLVLPNGTTEGSGDVFGYYVITHQYYNRYRLPIMHTETNMKMPDSVNWLYRQWANLHRLKQDGVPIVGFTWYSLTHQVDWDTALREDNGRIHEVGLYDLERNITPVGKAYKRLIEQWKDVLAAETFGMVYTH